MPDVADIKPAQTPAAPPIQAESPADRFAAGQATNTPEVSRKDFMAELTAAQALDAANKPAPKADAQTQPRQAPAATPEPAPSSASSPPKVPSLPQPEEWRPKGEKAGQQWDALKSKHGEETAALRAEIETLRKDLTSAKSGGTPEWEALRKERDQYRELLRDVAIERDPTFQQTYSTREKVAVDAAVQAAGDHGEKLGKLLKAPNSPWRDEQINKLVEDLPASSQRRINAALSVMEQVDVERSAEIARRRATFDEKQSALVMSQKEREAVVQREMMAAYEATEKQWRERHPFFQERKGDDAYNAEVAQSVELAKAIFNGQLSPQELAQAALWAASGERVLKGWQAAVKRAEAAESALDKMRGVQPGGDREGDTDESNAVRNLDTTSHAYVKAFTSWMREAQARDNSMPGKR